MATAPSFDVTSTVDLQEVDNALNQARKEVAQRYDFKGSKASIEFDAKESKLVLVADDARLRLPFVPLGVVPEAGSSYTIPTIVGRQQASYLLLTGEWLDAEGAVAAGLALRCVPRDDLLAEATALARQLAALSAPSLAATKRLIRAGWLDAARIARTREEEVFTTLLGHGASLAALDDFVKKRA